MPSFTPTYNGAKVNVSQAQLYYQPYLVGTPGTLPADTVALGTAWTTPWTPIGATDQGVTLNFSRKTQDIMIEEQQTPILVLSDSTDVSIDVVLAEDALEQLRVAMGGGTITVGTTSDTLVINSDISQFSIGLETKNPEGLARRFLFQPCVSTGNIKTQFRRAANKHMYSTSFVYTGAIENITIKNLHS